ncbi:hypothetical protein WQG_20100 [Bibersteinia trehalosi USDA-ARS-USMARC-192]|nr:hypothetical protein WQG_20100 [Bibersteinia trehalosi USDA-ARS-USMARC-192]
MKVKSRVQIKKCGDFHHCTFAFFSVMFTACFAEITILLSS